MYLGKNKKGNMKDKVYYLVKLDKRPGTRFLCDNPHRSTRPLLTQRLTYLKKKRYSKNEYKNYTQ